MSSQKQLERLWPVLGLERPAAVPAEHVGEALALLRVAFDDEDDGRAVLRLDGASRPSRPAAPDGGMAGVGIERELGMRSPARGRRERHRPARSDAGDLRRNGRVRRRKPAAPAGREGAEHRELGLEIGRGGEAGRRVLRERRRRSR